MRKLAYLLAFFVVIGHSLLGPSPVSAQGDPELFNGRDGCDINNPVTCRCLYVFRDNDTGEIYSFRGGRDANNIGQTLTVLPENHDIEYQVFTHIEDDNLPGQCYNIHQYSTSDFNELKGAALAGGACAVGSAVFTPLAACTVGSLAALAAGDELLSLTDNITNGLWSGDFEARGNCHWQDDPTNSNAQWNISEWSDYHRGDPDELVRIDRLGDERLFNDDDPTGKDDYYCGLLTQRYEGSFSAQVGDTNLEAFALCNQIPNGEEKGKCEDCFNGAGEFGGVDQGIWTAIGCIDKSSDRIVGAFVKIGVSIGGGIALLQIIAAGFLLTVSQGDPKKTSDAKEQMTSAIIGLLFVIFSVTILQFIGVQIFRLPGF